MLNCREVFGRDYFESYSEFYFALCMAAEMGRRGDALDMSGMVVDRSLLSKSELVYFKYLIGEGYIFLGKDTSGAERVDREEVGYYLDTAGFTSLKGKLVEDTGELYRWSVRWSAENYDDAPKDYRLVSKTGNLLMHLVAHLIVCEVLEEMPVKPLEIVLSQMDAKNTYFYVNLVSCSRTLPWFAERVILDVDYGDASVDIDYSIFCNNGVVAGRFKHWSIGDKHKFMEKLGFCVGSIVELWDRSGMCPSNMAGKINSVTIARLDEIGTDFIGVTTIALNKTKEETRLDYESIEESKRYLFRDMLDFKPYVNSKVLNLHGVGIENYFYDESNFITRINRQERVTKRITVDGVENDVEMSGIDAIYWLMCQYGFEFDRELYRQQYAEGRELLWDRYGGDSYEF